MIRIIHIEDAESVCEQVREAVDDWFGLENVAVEPIAFEKAAANFIANEANASDGVALIVVDLMIDYHSDDTLEVPTEVLMEGSFEAGIRLLRKLQDSDAWRNVPVLIYSSVEKAEVEKRLVEAGLRVVEVIQKALSLHPLLEQIQRIAGLKRLER